MKTWEDLALDIDENGLEKAIDNLTDEDFEALQNVLPMGKLTQSENDKLDGLLSTISGYWYYIKAGRDLIIEKFLD